MDEPKSDDLKKELETEEAVAKHNPRKNITTIIVIFALLFSYIFLASFFRLGCGGKVGRGDQAPDFTLPFMDGDKVKEVSLKDYRGKVLVLNFWASWCPPCKRELPSLMSLHKKFQNRDDFALLAISCDEEGFAPVKSLFGSRSIILPVANDKTMKVKDLYGVEKFPETFFIDKKGNVRRRYVGEWVWTKRKFIDEIEALLAE